MRFRNCLWFFGILMANLIATVAMASEEVSHVDPYASLGAALAIGVAAFGGALAQGKTSCAGLEAIGRNPSAQKKIFIPMIVGLALIESLVLYAFVVAFFKIKT